MSSWGVIQRVNDASRKGMMQFDRLGEMGKQRVSYEEIASDGLVSRQLERFLQIVLSLFALGSLACLSASWASLQRSLELNSLWLGLVAVGLLIASLFCAWKCYRAVRFERLINKLKSDWWQAIAEVADLKTAPAKMEGTINALNKQILDLEQKIENYKDGLDEEDPLGRISYWREKYLSLKREVEEGVYYDEEREEELFKWIAQVSGKCVSDVEEHYYETGDLPQIEVLSANTDEAFELSTATAKPDLSGPETTVSRFEKLYTSWPEQQAEVAKLTIGSLLGGVPLDFQDISTKLAPRQFDQLADFLKEVDDTTGEDTGIYNFIIDREADVYHRQIDAVVDATYHFLSETPWDQIIPRARSPYDLKTVSVFVVHLATLMAIGAFPDIHRSSLNGFTRSLALRTPNTTPDTVPPENMLVSYLSLEESFMQEQVEEYYEGNFDNLVKNLLVQLGAENSKLNVYTLRRFLTEASSIARETYVPHLAKS